VLDYFNKLTEVNRLGYIAHFVYNLGSLNFMK
jgi:hypothetical protein